MKGDLRLIVLASACWVLSLSSCVATPPDDDDDQGALADDWEPCEVDSDCASGLCGPERSQECLPNECVDGCAADTVCADYGYYFRCESPGDRGELCSYLDDLLQSLEKPCRESLICAVVSGSFVTEGYCVTEINRTVREPCDAGAQCSPPLVCAEEGRCLLPSGEPCTDGDVCESRYCAPNGVCAPNECRYPTTECEESSNFCGGGPCGRACSPPRQAGEICSSTDSICPENYACASGLLCSEQGTCVTN